MKRSNYRASNCIVYEHSDSECMGMFISPTTDIPGRGDVVGMVVVADNPNGKLKLAPCSSVWNLSLDEIGDVDAKDPPEGSYLRYMDGKWRAVEGSSSKPAGNSSEIQYSKGDYMGADSRLFFKNGVLTALGTITDSQIQIEKGHITANEIEFRKTPDIIIHTNDNTLKVDIKRSKGTIVIVPKQKHNSYKLTLAGVSADKMIFVDVSYPWVCTRAQRALPQLYLTRLRAGPSASGIIKIGYVIV